MRSVSIALFALVMSATSAAANDWSSGVSYVYDGSGNIRQIGTDYHVYDAVGRLVQSDTDGVRRNYSYDAFGNRKTCTQPGSDCQPGVTPMLATNRITGAAYGDGRGNVTAFEGHTYTYDGFNMQTRDVTPAVIREYIYTADDERIAVYTPTNGTWRWTLRDASGKVLRELASQNPANGTLGTASWRWVKDYVYRDGLLLASRQIDPATAAVTTYRYHLDHLGSPRRITDTSNRVVGRHTYYAFGPEASNGRLDEPSPTPLKYTGHERAEDPVSPIDSIDYMHARYYSPKLGRFLSVDPTWESADLGRPQSWNRYAYVMNNPVNMTDPDGKVPILVQLLGELATDFVTDGNPANVGADNPPRSRAEFDQRVRDGRAVRTVGTYEVGTVEELKSRSRGDKIDIHHAPQAKPAGQVIANYDPAKAPGIAVPQGEHQKIPTQKGSYTGTPRDLLAKDVRDLRKHTNAPNSALQKLVKLAKDTFPEALKRIF